MSSDAVFQKAIELGVLAGLLGLVVWLSYRFTKAFYVDAYAADEYIPITDARRRQFTRLERQRRQLSPDYEDLDFVG